MGGAINYVHRDGSRLTPWMLYVIERANAEFRSLFACELLVTSGIRTNEEQEEIFVSKFRVQATGNGPYGDVRWWKGQRWVRHVGGGTVAVPRTSNHEVQGSKAAVDLRDSGRDAGVASGGNARANWLRSNATRLGLIPSGYGFDEPWHYDIPDIFRTPPISTTSSGGSTAATFPEEEDDMKLYRWNGQHVFGIGRGEVYHVPDVATLSRLQKTHGEFKELDNDGLTAELNFAGVHWDAVDAVLTGRAPLAGGKLWSRLAAEGIAIRGNQAEQSKTLADVLSTAERISKNG